MVVTRSYNALSIRNAQNASHPHHNTPKKTRIRAACRMLTETDSFNGRFSKSAIFAQYGISRRRGYAILHKAYSSIDRTFHNYHPETCGQPHKIDSRYIVEMEKNLEDADIKTRAISWETLAYEAGLEDVSLSTTRRTMGRPDYHKCVACRKSNDGVLGPRISKKPVRIKISTLIIPFLFKLVEVE